MTTLNLSQTELESRLSTQLHSRHSLVVNQRWLRAFTSSIKTPFPPMSALVSTAHFRLLHSDITRSLATRSDTQTSNDESSNGSLLPLLLPLTITDVNIKSSVLPSNVPVQILMINDIGTSKTAQIEAIERVERGEEIRGREVIRTVPIMNEMNQGSTTFTGTNEPSSTAAVPASSTLTSTSGSAANIKKSHGPHKLLVQDAKGTQVYVFESIPVPKLFITNTPEEGGICIGAKLLLKKGCVVRRGMVMLKPEDVVVQGGKVDEWDVAWRKGRKARLMQELNEEHANARDDTT